MLGTFRFQLKIIVLLKKQRNKKMGTRPIPSI